MGNKLVLAIICCSSVNHKLFFFYILFLLDLFVNMKPENNLLQSCLQSLAFASVESAQRGYPVIYCFIMCHSGLIISCK